MQRLLSLALHRRLPLTNSPAAQVPRQPEETGHSYAAELGAPRKAEEHLIGLRAPGP